MERNLFDTVSLLGLDIMLAVIAALAALSALVRVLQPRRDRLTADETDGNRRPERHEGLSAGYAPPLSFGIVPQSPVTAEPVLADWIAAWLRREPAHDTAAPQVATPTMKRRKDTHEHEVA